MLTQLSTLKARLGITDTDPQYDALLTSAIKAVSARFDRLCRRTFARTIDATYDFPADSLTIAVPCYPIESVFRYLRKPTEACGWLEIPDVSFLIRHACVISLTTPLGSPDEQGRVIYTGGYVLPGTTPASGQTTLPDDLEHAAAEQAAFWFQTRERVGAIREWPKSGVYVQFADLDLLPHVRSLLKRYERWI